MREHGEAMTTPCAQVAVVQVTSKSKALIVVLLLRLSKELSNANIDP